MSVTPFTTFRFEVVLDLDSPVPGLDSPLCDAAFSDCDGLEMTMEPKTVQQGGFNNFQAQLIGPMKFSQVTLKRGMTSNLQLWTWMAMAGQGTVAMASGHITMWDTDATPVIEFGIWGCLPVRMRAPSLNAREGVLAIEELGLVYQTLTISAAGSGGGFGGAPVGLSLSDGASFSAAASVTAGASLSASAGASASLSAGASASVSGGASASVSGGASL
jgi:phage tail-like protein